MTRYALQASLGLGDREHFRKTYLLPTLEAGLVEMNSRSQRYCLTPAGKVLRAKRKTT